MSRWKPPSPRSSIYITPAGLDRLKLELKTLWIERRDVVAALSAAAAEGDRSENAEYIYRKKQLREMDRRIRYLSKRTEEVRPVVAAPTDPERVYFGATIRVADLDGRESPYRIVGADETDAARGWISVDSPLARALLGKRLNDEVEVATPGGVRRVEIIAVDYEA